MVAHKERDLWKSMVMAAGISSMVSGFCVMISMATGISGHGNTNLGMGGKLSKASDVYDDRYLPKIKEQALF